MRVKIYSNEHNGWWRSNYCGYTTDESKAGVFEIEEVNEKYPYIDFDTKKEDYLVKFEGLTYEELEKENQELKNDSFNLGIMISENKKLEKELDIFKLAFYTLWKCCNSDEALTDIQKESGAYLEFKCGFENICIPASEQELESIKKACELLDINVKDVLGNE